MGSSLEAEFINQINGASPASTEAPLDDLESEFLSQAEGESHTGGALGGAASVFTGAAEALAAGIQDPSLIAKGIESGVAGIGMLGESIIHHPYDTAKALIIDGFVRPLLIMPGELIADRDFGSGKKLSDEERYRRGQEVSANYTGLAVGFGLGKVLSAGGKVAEITKAAKVRNLAELSQKMATMPSATVLKIADIAANPSSYIKGVAKGATEGSVGGGVVGLGTGDTPEERFNNAFNYGVAGAILGSALETNATRVTNKRIKPLGPAAIEIAARQQTALIMNLPAENAVKAASALHSGIVIDQVMLRNTPKGATVVLHSLNDVSPEVRDAPNTLVHKAEDGTYRVIIDNTKKPEPPSPANAAVETAPTAVAAPPKTVADYGINPEQVNSIMQDAGLMNSEIARGGDVRAMEGYAYVDGALKPVDKALITKVREAYSAQIEKYKKLREHFEISDENFGDSSVLSKYLGSDTQGVGSRESAIKQVDSLIAKYQGEIGRYERQHQRHVDVQTSAAVEAPIERRLEEMTRLAYTDTQTGFQNRNAWEKAVTSKDWKGMYHGLLDIVGLRHGANNVFGQAGGDVLIQDAVRAIKKAIADEGAHVRVFKLGGDEFNVVGSDRAQIERIMEKAKQNIGIRKSKGTQIAVGLRSGVGESFEAASEAMLPEKSRKYDLTSAPEFDPTPEITATKGISQDATIFTAAQKAEFDKSGYMQDLVILHEGKEYAYVSSESAGKLRAVDLSTGRNKVLDKSKVKYAPKFEFATVIKTEDPTAPPINSAEPKPLLDKPPAIQTKAPSYTVPTKYQRAVSMYRAHRIKFASEFDRAMYYHGLKEDIISTTGISPGQYEAHRVRILDALREARKAATKEGEELNIEPVPFDDSIQSTTKPPRVKKVRPVYERTGIEAVQRDLAEQHAEIMKEFTPEEIALYEENKRAIEVIQDQTINSITRSANQGGFVVESKANGALEIKDFNTGVSHGVFKTQDEALAFMNKGGTSVGDILIDTDGPRGGGIIPPNGLGDVGKSKYDGEGAKFLERARGTFIQLAGGFFPRADLFKAIESLDPRARLHSDVYMKMSPALMKTQAMVHPWMTRLKDMQDTLFKGLSKDRRDLVYDYISTASPAERTTQVAGKGYSKTKPMTEAEIHLGQLIAQDLKNAGHDISSLERAFQYRRVRLELSDNLKPWEVEKAMKKFEVAEAQKPNGWTPMSDAEKALVKRLDSASAEPLERMRLGAVTSLARSVLTDEKSKPDFAKLHKMTPQELAAAQGIEQWFSDIAPHLDISPHRLLNNYISHIRDVDFGDLTRSDLYKEMGALDKEFFASLSRTGEISQVVKDPIEIAARYVSAGMKSKYLNAAVDEARKNLDEIARQVGDTSRVGIRTADEVKSLGDRYINQALGQIESHDALVMRAMDHLFKRVAKTTTTTERRSFVNAWLRASEFAAQGFKPIAGGRDIGSFTQVFGMRFGATRFAKGMKLWAMSDSPAARLKQFGETPGLANIYTLSQGEALARDVTEGARAKLNKASQILRKAEEAGFKYSFQPTVYENAHAFVYGEVFHTVGDNLTKLVKGTISRNEFEKAIMLDTYETAIRGEFNRILDSKKYVEATQYLAKVSGQEVVGYYGMANHPYLFSGRFGRLAGQFGQWPLWAISATTRMMTQGSKATKAATLARASSFIGVIALTHEATGINLTNWSVNPKDNMWSGGPALQMGWLLANAVGSQSTPTRDFARNQLENMWKRGPKNINIPIPFQTYDSWEGAQRLLNGDPLHIAGWKFLGGQVDSNLFPRPD